MCEATTTELSIQSAPWKRAIGFGEQFPLVITVKSKGSQKGLFLSHDLFCHELADTDHLISMTGIGNHVAVLPHDVKNGEIIRTKGPEAARRLLFVTIVFVFIPFLAVGQGGCPGMGKIGAPQ